MAKSKIHHLTHASPFFFYFCSNHFKTALMNMYLFVSLFSLISSLLNPAAVDQTPQKNFDWKNATVYFLMTDRFLNADSTNDIHFNRTEKAAYLRNFEGGDIKGITKKIEEGYFNKLGVNVIWFSPVMEQIHGYVDEGQGKTYAFHGYWPRDWSSMEPNFGTSQDLKELMHSAHTHQIRIMMDVIINHTGPVTEVDPVWPSDWVRTSPQCTYQDSQSTISCTLVKNLPDILTNQTHAVELPQFLLDKWEADGRLDQEIRELDAFFARTGYPRTPRYYIIKWLTDYIREFGIDAFRVDTVKHTEAGVWTDLAKEANIAFEEWKNKHHEPIQEGQDFFMLGEVYNYNALSGQEFDFGDIKVNYFQHGFQSLINFGFKGDANRSYEDLFSAYSKQLHKGDLKGLTVMNYISSHDDGYPFDLKRARTYESATKLLLSPGMAQIYYGDEIARPLVMPGAEGDANLRGMMPWQDAKHQELLSYWQKLGQFREKHLAIGAGEHRMISQEPCVFMRTYIKGSLHDRVLVGLDLPKKAFEVDLSDFYQDGDLLLDTYSHQYYPVRDGKISIKTDAGIVLIEQIIK